LTRAIAPSVVLVAMLAAGCSSASPGSGGGTAPASTAPAAAPTAPASPAPPAAAVIPPGGASAGAIPSDRATISAWASDGPASGKVYLAESQDPRGTTAREPRCGAGCPLSGDGTTVLWNMTWSRWNGAEAVGAGTERIESCDPDCASGGQYAVKVVVTLTKPVKDCGAGGIYFWTHASFAWPAGLPAALSGGSAPINPWDFGQLRAQATASCTQP
jgi:hypothetical protein